MVSIAHFVTWDAVRPDWYKATITAADKLPEIREVAWRVDAGLVADQTL